MGGGRTSPSGDAATEVPTVPDGRAAPAAGGADAGEGSGAPRRRGPLDETVAASSDAGAPLPLPSPRSSRPPAALPVPSPPLSEERYRLGAELGRGGMGRVVEAFDLQLGRTVALKEVLPRGDEGTIRRFEREVQLTARLEHPSIVPIYDSGVTSDGRPFYVMRRVSGRPFDELVARARGLGERLTLLPALLAAIDAVAHAHRRGVIHRDLKPQNILVGELGETVVIDWGLAKVLGETDPSSGGGGSSLPSGPLAPPTDGLRTQVGSVFGTPGFMSPEQARGEELGTRGDVFALGATLYQLLAGTPPHQGTSATEVLDKTVRHDVRPLAEVAPGAPAELVAIVDQALAFDPRKRYPDAGALGEDVRRFLAGQLVAAHRYTPLERAARFARRHRAPLAVASLALVTVAVLAWIGVARIVTERDAADTARAAAIAGRREAEAARDDLAERADALLLTQARALLETNPTEAAATLKLLGPGSPRLPEARALAQAAAMRGVAWAVESTHEVTTTIELEPGGHRLLQLSRDGAVRVWDAARRALVLARSYPRDSRARWVAGGRVLVTRAGAPPQLLHPDANTSEPLAIEPPVALAASAGGELLAFTGAGGGVTLFDVERRQATAVDAEARGADLALAPDGSWLAIAERGEPGGRGPRLRVLDAGGRELLQRPGGVSRIAASPARALAVITDTGAVVECRLDPAPACAELPLAAAGVALPHRVIDLVYRGAGELAMWATSGALVGWNGARVFRRAELGRVSSGLYVAAGDTLVVAGAEGELHFVNDLVQGTLTLPSAVPRARIAARPDATRVLVAGDGIVLGFDLAAVLPRILPAPPGMRAMFVDDHTLLASQGINFEWQWIDAVTGRERRFEHLPRGLPQVIEIDPPSGRVLVREIGEVQRLLLFRRGTPEVRVIGEGAAVWGRTTPGDAIVYGVGDGRVLARVEDGEPREVVKLDGVAEGAVALGYRRFAARSSAGELVRGDLATGAVERARGAAGAAGFVAADAAGRVLVVEDARLLAWDGALHELAALPRPIARVDAYEGGAVLHLADGEVYALALAPGAAPRRVLPPSRRGAVASYDGRLLLGLGHAQQLEVVELPAVARWTLPVRFAANDVLAVSPAARRVVQGADRHLAIWTLPEAGADLGAWLDGLTNATVDAGGVLAWPWQRAAPAAATPAP